MSQKCLACVGTSWAITPTGKRMQFKNAGQKLCNMLRAHPAACKVIIQLPGYFTAALKTNQP